MTAVWRGHLFILEWVEVAKIKKNRRRFKKTRSGGEKEKEELLLKRRKTSLSSHKHSTVNLNLYYNNTKNIWQI